MCRAAVRVIATAVVVVAGSTSAWAQTYAADARHIAMGGAGGTRNVAAAMIDSRRRGPDVVVLPFGLLQLLGSLELFDPDHDDYNPVRAIEYVANPLHYTFGRRAARAGPDLLGDLFRRRLSADVRDYAGTSITSAVVAEGLAFPQFGGSVGLVGSHRLYLGGGPYLTTRASTSVDTALTALLQQSANDPIRPGQSGLGASVVNQLAIAGSLGYRGRLIGGGGRASLYVAGDVHYLHGLWLDDLRMRIDLDAASSAGAATIERITSTHGRGVAADAGVMMVVPPWRLGVGVTGFGNRLDWGRRDLETLSASSLSGGAPFVRTISNVAGTDRRSIPADVVTDVGFADRRWTAAISYGRGFLGSRVHAGAERHLGAVDVRGGLRRIRGRWHPSMGVGLKMTRTAALDVALFGVEAAIDRRRYASLAVSLRFGDAF